MPKPLTHIVCYSGGHSSALVAIEVVRRYGKKNVILLNHDIHPNVEDADIKRFKRQIARHLGLKVTYANMSGWKQKDQFDVVTALNAFKVGQGNAICSHHMKVAPFHDYLEREFPNRDCVIYYGFDKNETSRIQRRSGILGSMGYMACFPLAEWIRTIQSTQEIGIDPPRSYSKFKHANCTGCLKAGKQHWYVVYCLRPDIWERGKWAEDQIGYSIFGDVYLDELEEKFEIMWDAGVPADENIPPGQFWATARKMSACSIEDARAGLPCECLA